MIKVVIKTPLNIEELLKYTYELARMDDPSDRWYKRHPGFTNWIDKRGNNLYTIDGDLLTLRMMELLPNFKCAVYCAGGIYEEGEESEWTDDEWKKFMDVYTHID